MAHETTVSKEAYLYLPPGMADWGVGHLISELNSRRFFRENSAPWRLRTVAVDRTPVCSMGGLTLLPDLALDEVDFSQASLFILPGCAAWRDERHGPVFDAVATSLANEGLVAAVCTSVFALARQGLLNERAHTANSLAELKESCPGYRGEAFYQKAEAVQDGGLITGSGYAPLAFAKTVLQAIDVCAPQMLNAWYNLYKTQDSKYMFELMLALKD